MVREDLAPVLRGWGNYFGYCETPDALRKMDSWIRRRLRSYLWKLWQHKSGRYRGLLKHGIDVDRARIASGWRAGPWQASRSRVMLLALPESFFRSIGLPTLYVAPNA